jgi:hypothetical protein
MPTRKFHRIHFKPAKAKPRFYWNYRLIWNEEHKCFATHEVYYTDDKINSWTERDVGILCKDIEEFKEIMKEIALSPLLMIKNVDGKEVLVPYE